MSVDGTFPEAVPLPMGFEGSFSANGSRIAYVPMQRGFAAWKRYRGGMTTPIWIANLSDSVIEKIPRENSNDFCPMWSGDRVYFLSDRNGPITLFSFDTKLKKVTEIIPNRGLDIKSASLGPDAIVYEQFGSLNLFDLKSGKSQKVNVTITADQLAVRPRYEKVANRINNAAISPTGARAVFEARGEILSVPAEKGDARNLQDTRCRRAGSVGPPMGNGSLTSLMKMGIRTSPPQSKRARGVRRSVNSPSFFYSPTWSPDSKKVAYTDKRLNYWYVDIERDGTGQFDTAPITSSMSWSPDSRWITRKHTKSLYRAVFLYSLEGNKTADY